MQRVLPPLPPHARLPPSLPPLSAQGYSYGSSRELRISHTDPYWCVPQIDMGSWEDLGDGDSHPFMSGNNQEGGGTCVLQLAIYAESGASGWSAEQAISFSISASQYEEATVRLSTPDPNPDPDPDPNPDH